MEATESFFRKLYNDFNERNIESVIAQMTEDVKWANGMEGGHVHGHEGVRQYWTRQFTQVLATVTPLEIETEKDIVHVHVHQVVHGTEGHLLADQTVEHFFRLEGGKIAQFDIGGTP